MTDGQPNTDRGGFTPDRGERSEENSYDDGRPEFGAEPTAHDDNVDPTWSSGSPEEQARIQASLDLRNKEGPIVGLRNFAREADMAKIPRNKRGADLPATENSAAEKGAKDPNGAPKVDVSTKALVDEYAVSDNRMKNADGKQESWTEFKKRKTEESGVKPGDSPTLQEIKKLIKAGEELPDGVRGNLLVMEKHGTIKDPNRVAQLAKMDLDTLKKQPEYQEYSRSKIADETNSAIEHDPEFIETKIAEITKQLQEMGVAVDLINNKGLKEGDQIPESTGGKTTVREVMAKMTKEEAAALVEQRVAAAKDALQPGEQLSAEEEDAIRNAAREEAAIEAQTMAERWLQGAAEMVGGFAIEFMDNSVLDSDIGSFISLLFEQSRSGGGHSSRERGWSTEHDDKTREMVHQDTVTEHLKNKDKLIKVLTYFYDEADDTDYTNNPDPDIEALRAKIKAYIPDNNYEAELANPNVSLAKLQEIVQAVGQVIDNEKQDGSSPGFAVLNRAILKSMEKDPKKFVVDSRMLLGFQRFGQANSFWKQ